MVIHNCITFFVANKYTKKKKKITDQPLDELGHKS